MPLYDYQCTKCDAVWEEVHKMANNKLPESLPCPKCLSVDTVQQTIAYTRMPMSATLESSRAIKKLNHSAFAEKMNMIHQASPESNMHNASSIVDIK